MPHPYFVCGYGDATMEVFCLAVERAAVMHTMHECEVGYAIVDNASGLTIYGFPSLLVLVKASSHF